MTAEEVKVVVKLMMTADNGCSECAGSLLEDFVEQWPEHLPLVKEIWLAKYDKLKDWMETQSI